MTDDDLRRVRALANTLSAMNIGQYRVKDGEGREITAESRTDLTIQLRNLLAGFADDDLLTISELTEGEPSNPEADALLAEIGRRGLNV